MQDYRDEINDFFAVDKQLASELEYDMKKYNEQLAQEQELARQAEVNRATEGAAGSPGMQVHGQPFGPTLLPFCSLLCVCAGVGLS